MCSPYFYLRVILVHSELNLAKFDQIYRKITFMNSINLGENILHTKSNNIYYSYNININTILYKFIRVKIV